jgi:hypothetical protein
MTLTEDDFKKQCIQFVSRSKQYADEGWYLSAKLDNGRLIKLCLDNLDSSIINSEGKLMLMKDEKRRSDKSETILNYEYNVIYSDSYEVPVMYFCVSDQNGAHAPLEQLLTAEHKDLSMVVNQVEHPLLFRPFFMIHPCRTKDFMEPHVKVNKEYYLISWLSMVANLIGLRMSSDWLRIQ